MDPAITQPRKEPAKGSATNAALLTVEQVAELMSCSGRTIRRLADAGRMPRPVAVARLRRWNRAAILAWIESGCPDIRREGGNRRHGR